MNHTLAPDVLKVMQALKLAPRDKEDNAAPTVTKESLAQELGITPDVLSTLAALGVKTNANEVMHTTQTGYGKELVPLNVLSAEILEIVPKFSTLLSKLPGNHGTGLAVSEKVPVIGDPGLFLGNTEWTTGTPAQAQGNTKNPTQEVTINQGQFIMTIDVSKRLLNYSVADLEQILKMKLAQSFGRTIDALIINGDTEAGATGNVNLDDAAPSTTAYYMQVDHGLRELAINAAASAGIVDVGTFEFADFLDVLNKMGDLASDPSQILFLFNQATYIKALGITEFKDAAQNGKGSTIHTGSITNILGSDLLTCRDIGKTEADGKISTTAASNTKGQFLAIYAPAIQYGFGQSLEIDVVKVPGKGIQIVATGEFGFGILETISGVTGRTVAAGIDVTV